MFASLLTPKKSADNLTEMLPHWEIRDNLMFLQRGGVEFAFAVTPPSSTFAGELGLERMHANMKLLLHTLPLGVRLRCTVESRLGGDDAVKQYFDRPLAHPMLERRRVHSRRAWGGALARGEVRDYRYWLSVYVPGPPLKNNRRYTPGEYDALVKTAHECFTLVQAQLRVARLNPVRFDDQMLFEAVWRHYNPDFAAEPPEFVPVERRLYPTKEALLGRDDVHTHSLRRQVLACELENHLMKSLKVGSRYLGTVSLQSVPKKIWHDYLRELCLELSAAGVTFAVISDFLRESDASIKRSVETAIRTFNSEGKGGGMKTDAAAGVKEKRLTDGLEYMEVSGDAVFRSGLGIVFHAPDLKTLGANRAAVMAALARLGGSSLHAGTVENPKQFIQTLAPLSGGQNVYSFLTLERDSADFLPTSGPWAGCRRATSLFLSRWGSPVGVDYFDPDLYNYNGAIVGGSGSGKSVLAQGIILDSLAQREDIVVVDKGFSYLTLCDLLSGDSGHDGQVNLVSFEPGKSAVNIFELPQGTVELPAEKVGQVVEFLEAILPNIKGGEAATRRAILYAATEQSYEYHARFEKPHGSALVQRVMHPFTLSNFVERLEKLSAFRGSEADSKIKAQAREIAVQLYPFTGNTRYGMLLDRPTNLNLDGEFLYIEYSALDRYKDLTDVVVLLLNELVWQRVHRRPGVRSKAFFDECWSLLERPAACAVVARSYREARKYGLGTYAVSQTVSDLAKVPGILGSTSIFFLGAGLSEANLLEKEAGFPKRAAEQVSSLGRGLKYGREFLLGMRFGQGEADTSLLGDVVRYQPDPFTYWASSTNAADKALRARTLERDGVVLGLEKLAREVTI